MNASYAIVLTHDRPELLARCVRAISPQVDRVIVVDNASPKPFDPHAEAGWPSTAEVVYVPDQPPNLSRLWNTQLDRIAQGRAVGQWDIAILCDDAIVPATWFRTVVGYMRAVGAVAASTPAIDSIQETILKIQPDSDIYSRMCGCAFVLAGEAGLRADETMHWWWNDTDLDWQARAAGGMALTPGPVVPNGRPNDFTNSKPELGTRAGLDGQRFVEKHGWRPW